jgi:hypothetical protein
MAWESSTVDLTACIVTAKLFIAATKSSIAPTLFSRIGTWL